TLHCTLLIHIALLFCILHSTFHFTFFLYSLFIYLYRMYILCFLVLMCSTFLMCSTYLCFYVFMLCVVLIVFLCFYVLCLLYAPSHQTKFQVAVNLRDNKSHSDSDSDSDSDYGRMNRREYCSLHFPKKPLGGSISQHITSLLWALNGRFGLAISQRSLWLCNLAAELRRLPLEGASWQSSLAAQLR